MCYFNESCGGGNWASERLSHSPLLICPGVQELQHADTARKFTLIPMTFLLAWVSQMRGPGPMDRTALGQRPISKGFPLGFPGGSVSKESACNVGNLGSIPGLGISPRGGHGNPLQYSCLENPQGQRSLVGCSPYGRRVELDWVTQHSTLKHYPHYMSYRKDKPNIESLVWPEQVEEPRQKVTLKPREKCQPLMINPKTGMKMDHRIWQSRSYWEHSITTAINWYSFILF